VFRVIRDWFHRYFSDVEAVLLFFILILGFSLVIFTGNFLTPVLASLVFAYLLESPVDCLQRWNIPRLAAVLIVFLGFLSILLLSILVLLPLIWKQFISLFNEIPNMVMKGEEALKGLSQHYPNYFSEEQVKELVSSLVSDARNWGKVVITASLSSIVSIITWVVYLILMPFLVFFFLKDKDALLNWVSGLLPHKRGVLQKVASEVNEQIGNYLRGKVTEIIIVSLATYIVFWIFDLNYSALLAAQVGLSVLIPYIGIVVATIPVIIVSFIQWGWSPQFGYFMLVYSILQELDALILVPLLFSEAVNLHPVAIVVATLFFGGIWGIWGVFFAIPLATLIKAVINAWPRTAKAH